MSQGNRIEGRIALSDFYTVCPDSRPRGDWEDRLIYCLGLFNSLDKDLPEDASDVVKEARKYVFTGYNGREYPHFIALRPEPLMAILRSLQLLRGLSDEVEQSSEYIRQTPAKISQTLGLAVLISADSRKIWPSIDPGDINWDCMHYAERLLSSARYKEIVALEQYAFLRAISAKLPPGV